MSDAVQTGPWMPDEATREGLGERLRAAGAGLRQSSVEIQQIIDDLESQQADSPLGRFHARRRAEVQAN
ncbi:MAG: hypothetical protein H7Y22_13150 [Gemmatimonadaceae bacterium]|nr:hypothetical protein [Gloeobacterales cyanobacterium ES-bin-141]